MHIKKKLPYIMHPHAFHQKYKNEKKKKKIHPQHAFRNNKYYFHCVYILIKKENKKI